MAATRSSCCAGSEPAACPGGGTIIRLEALARGTPARRLTLEDGARVAVVGGGPAGSLCAAFLMDFADRRSLDLRVDIFDAKDFSSRGPGGCNHCGGIISESLVQHLAAEGIVLPGTVVRRGIDAYVLHVEDGSVDIGTPLHEKRIAAVYRGGGPRGDGAEVWASFDGFLLDLASRRGVTVNRRKVSRVDFSGDRPRLELEDGAGGEYDLVVGAVGVNVGGADPFADVRPDTGPPLTTRTYISEFRCGRAAVRDLLGDAMHVFLLDIPGLQFGAIIPKGEFATLVMLGNGIDKAMVERFLAQPEVRSCFPVDVEPGACFACQCYPRINVRAPGRPWADRLVMIGDAGATKLYKNGLGAAYLAAKAAAATAVFDGVSARAFARGYGPLCRAIERDNRIGRLIFAATGIVRRLGFAKRAFLRVIAAEQARVGSRRRLSGVMWDTFTGSAPYGDILRRMLHPLLLADIVREVVMGPFRRSEPRAARREAAAAGELGRSYEDGEVIVRQGEPGQCMYVVQRGRVRVCRETPDGEVPIAELGQGAFFGEMSLFEKDVRSSTVRALGRATVLTVDQHTLLRQITANPSLALHLIREMSARIRSLTHKHARVLQHDRRDWDSRPTAWSRE